MEALTPVTRNPFPPVSPLKPLEYEKPPVKQNEHEQMYVCTIRSVEETPEGSVWLRVTAPDELITTAKPATAVHDSRKSQPVLPPPDNVDRRTLEASTRELNLTLTRLKEVDETDLENVDCKVGDVLIRKLTIQSIYKMQELLKDGILLNQKNIKLKRGQNEENKTERLAAMKKQAKLAKKGKLLGWIKIGFMTGGLATFIVATVAAIVASGGSASAILPGLGAGAKTIFASIQAVFAVTTGATQLTEGIVQWQYGRIEGTAFALKIWRNANNEIMIIIIENLKTGFQTLGEKNKQLSQIIQEHAKTATAVSTQTA